jgi:hypothetical protein
MVDIRRNDARNRIEVAFPSKPTKEIRLWLLSKRFQYFKAEQYWYNKFTEELLNEVTVYLNHFFRDVEIPNNELAIGIEIEKEHTTDTEEARKIAMDHLKENPKYYSEAKPENWGIKELKAEAMKELGGITSDEFIFLDITHTFKSQFRDAYLDHFKLLSRKQEVKDSLISKKLMTKNGAITASGKKLVKEIGKGVQYFITGYDTLISEHWGEEEKKTEAEIKTIESDIAIQEVEQEIAENILVKDFFREQDGFKLYLVDGNAVRKDHIEFTMGGHGYVYDYIPKDEVWIDENLKDKPDDMEATIKHELFEIKKMRDEGLTYDDAHELASNMEKEVRQSDDSKLYTLPELREIYSFKNGYNLSELDLDNIASGTHTRYASVGKLRGTYPDYEREPQHKGFIIDSDYKWFVEAAAGQYKETTSPYKTNIPELHEYDFKKGDKVVFKKEFRQEGDNLIYELIDQPGKGRGTVRPVNTENTITANEVVQLSMLEKAPIKSQILDVFLPKIKIIKPFLSQQQLDYLTRLYRSEEKEAAIEYATQIASIIEAMPKTYETDDVKSNDKIVHLHYFLGDSNWYIVEKDKGQGRKEEKETGLQYGKQYEAYGYAILNGDYEMAEWGYVSIQELIENNVELDFHWSPKSFSEVKRKWHPEEVKIASEEISIPGQTEEDIKNIDPSYDVETGLRYKRIFEKFYPLGLKEKFKITNYSFNEGTLQLFLSFAKGSGYLDLSRGARRENYTGEGFDKLEDVEYFLHNALSRTAEEILAQMASPSKQWVSKPKPIIIEDPESFSDITEKTILMDEIESLEKNIHNGEKLMGNPHFTGDVSADIAADRKKVEKKQILLAKFGGTYVSKTPESVPESAISVTKSDYANEFELNKAIEALLTKKWYVDSWSEAELEFIKGYTGYGGLDKFGEITKGSLFEYFTPDKVIEKMWGLAYKFGYKDGPIIEPSCGIGPFFDRRFVSNLIEKHGYEINKYSAKIAKLLYPEAIINDGAETKFFEQLFIVKNYTVRAKVTPKYQLAIGNPPYGAVGGIYMGMGEKSFTHANNYIDYFILRGLDLLFEGGLLIYIIGAETAGGGVPFLDQGMNKVKEMIMERGKLIDAYRLPSGVFSRTDVTSDIVVFRKR